MAPQDLRFRAATTDDLDRVLEVHLTAFPDDRGVEERRRSFTASRFGTLEDLIVVERGKDLVGHACLFPFEAWFGGRAVRVGGIASVGIAPEARGQGVGTALLHHLHVASDVRGDACTMLYAFRQQFYTRLGYGTTSSRRRLVMGPRSVPASWRALARARVRRTRGEDKDALRAAYARAAARSTGLLTRPDRFWDRHLAREQRQFLLAERPAREGGGISGYVAFEVETEEAHAAVSLVVHELVADDDVTRLALVGALAAMRDQVASIELEVEDTDPLERALVDSDAHHFGTARVEHELGVLVGGPLVRVEDVPRAIEGRGYVADGAFDIVVHASEGEGDGRGAGEEIAVSVTVESGRAVVSAARGASSALRTSRGGLASMLFGGLRPSDAARMGLADADARTLARADAIFTIPPFLPVDPF